MNKNESSLPSSDLLHTFSVIAECRNLTHASARLNRTQSAVSVQLRKLEENIGETLFSRQSNGMVLTDSGKRLLPKAIQILTELRQIGSLFQSPLIGHISIGIPDDLNGIELEHSLVQFKSGNPGVEIEAWSGCTSKYTNAIETGELDIAVCSGPEVYAGEFLSSEAIVWACAENLVISPIAPLPLAILNRDCWWRDIPLNALNSDGRSWKIAYKSDSFSCLRSAIRAGFALGVLPIGSMQPGMRILCETDGFPPLPLAKRTVLRSAKSPPDLVDSMIEAIRGAVTVRPIE